MTPTELMECPRCLKVAGMFGYGSFNSSSNKFENCFYVCRKCRHEFIVKEVSIVKYPIGRDGTMFKMRFTRRDYKEARKEPMGDKQTTHTSKEWVKACENILKQSEQRGYERGQIHLMDELTKVFPELLDYDGDDLLKVYLSEIIKRVGAL